MKTNTPLKDDSCRTWPEIEAELRGRFGGVALHYQLLAHEAKWQEGKARMEGNDEAECIFGAFRLRIGELLVERAEEIHKSGCPLMRVKVLEKACREMRHSLVGEGWTQEQLQTAFGDVGAVVPTAPHSGSANKMVLGADRTAALKTALQKITSQFGWMDGPEGWREAIANAEETLANTDREEE